APRDLIDERERRLSMKSEAAASADRQCGTPQEASVSLSLWKPPSRRKDRASGSPPPVQRMPGAHHIELNLRDINQLFNTLDPSPFHEKDLDHDAEEFILSWATEFPLNEPIELTVHLAEFPAGTDPRELIEQAVHHYFGYRTRLNRLDFRQLMQQGRQSLL